MMPFNLGQAALIIRIGLAVKNIEERLYRVLSNIAKEHGAQSARGVVIQFPLTHESRFFNRCPKSDHYPGHENFEEGR